MSSWFSILKMVYIYLTNRKKKCLFLYLVIHHEKMFLICLYKI